MRAKTLGETFFRGFNPPDRKFVEPPELSQITMLASVVSCLVSGNVPISGVDFQSF
jgi:hypothetical protein